MYSFPLSLEVLDVPGSVASACVNLTLRDVGLPLQRALDFDAILVFSHMQPAVLCSLELLSSDGSQLLSATRPLIPAAALHWLPALIRWLFSRPLAAFGLTLERSAVQ